LYKTLFTTNFVRNTYKFYNFLGNNYLHKNYLSIKILKKIDRKKYFFTNFLINLQEKSYVIKFFTLVSDSLDKSNFKGN